MRAPISFLKLGVISGQIRNGAPSVTASTSAHHEIVVDGDPQPHVVNRLARRDLAAELVHESVGLDVGQVAFDVPQAVGAPIAVEFYSTGVQVLAFGGGGEGHVGSQAGNFGVGDSSGAL